MSIEPFDSLSDPGIPGYRLTEVYESAHTKTKVLAADFLPREDESQLTENPGEELNYPGLLGALPALFGLPAFLVGCLTALFLPAAAAVTLGVLAGIGVALLTVLSFQACERERQRDMAARPTVFADHQAHMVRLCSTRHPVSTATRAEERLGEFAYEAAHRYHEASAAAAGDPVLTVHLPDIPDIARDALDAYRDGAWPPAEETEEREQIESILADSRERDDDAALRRLRARRVELTDRVRERARVDQGAHDALVKADNEVRHLLSRVRAREHLARKDGAAVGATS